MYQSKVIGPVVVAGTAVSSLPVTGNSVSTLVLTGLGLVAAGLLLVRSSRLERVPAGAVRRDLG